MRAMACGEDPDREPTRHALRRRHTGPVYLTSSELAIILALGTSAVTGTAALGAVWLRERLRRDAAARDTLAASIT
jgi:hypothetical protein